MKAKLREMDVREFETFRVNSINDYAKDLMAVEDISLEHALEQAESEFSDMLPDGMKTRDHSLMMIEDESDYAKSMVYYGCMEGESSQYIFDD